MSAVWREHHKSYMFLKQVILDQDSMIEVSTRLIDGQDMTIISIRGKKNAKEIMMISAALSPEEVGVLVQALTQAAQYKTSVE